MFVSGSFNSSLSVALLVQIVSSGPFWQCSLAVIEVEDICLESSLLSVVGTFVLTLFGVGAFALPMTVSISEVGAFALSELSNNDLAKIYGV